MKRFIKDILLYLLPFFLLVVVIVPFYAGAVRCGEFYKLDKSIEYQRENHNSIIGLGYNEQTAYYKLKNANYYQADVLALGTSRVMQFKKEFFLDCFYNCGGAVAGNYNEYMNFLKNLNYKPKCILLGLDAWVFNDAWNRQCEDYNDFVKIVEISRSKGAMLKGIIADWLKGKWTFDSLDDYPYNIGFNGRIKDSGFMYDGSYYYGYIYRAPEVQEDYLFVNTLDRIEYGKYRFEWGDNIDQDTLVQLQNLLTYCKDNNIYVIGFVAPFAPTIYETMKESGNYGYIKEISPACEKLFNEYGYEFYDFIDVSNLNVTDDCFIDGFHGSEIVYGYMLEDMISRGSIIIQYIDISTTKSLLQNTFDGRTFYDPDKRIIE